MKITTLIAALFITFICLDRGYSSQQAVNSKPLQVVLTLDHEVSKEHAAKITRVANNLPQVLNSQDFQLRVFNHRHKNVRTFFSNEGLTNEQVYDRLMRGSELLNKTIDYTWQMKIKTRWLFSTSTVAYTTASSSFVTMNTKFLNRSSDAQVAKTLCHEHTHQLGFTHTEDHTPDRPFTVPYAVGDICEEIYSYMFPVPPKESNTKPYCGFWCRIKNIF